MMIVHVLLPLVDLGVHAVDTIVNLANVTSHAIQIPVDLLMMIVHSLLHLIDLGVHATDTAFDLLCVIDDSVIHKANAALHGCELLFFLL